MLTKNLRTIKLADPVFAPRQAAAHTSTLPACIHQCEITGRIDAFKLNWKEGDPNKPHIFWDSDVAKVMEGLAQHLMSNPNAALEKRLDEIVDLIISSQQDNGFLNSYYSQFEHDKRWKVLGGNHVLYCAGHLIEAAVAHYDLTGDRKFLDCMCRYADHINEVFGKKEGQIPGYPGHEELELALVKLYRTTGEKKYLDLAKFFIDERGTEPNYFAKVEGISVEHLRGVQAHLPVREQETAEGHAVRALYLYCGMVDVAIETNDPELLNAAMKIYDNATQKRMYITGGVGTSPFGERFTYDYDLPNDSAYTESCAAIALAMLSKRLLDHTNDSKYAEVLERVLYNNGISGISINGDDFIYNNYLEVRKERNVHRTKWIGCSCCPTNYARFIPQLGLFCFSVKNDMLRIDIPAAATITNQNYEVKVSGGYPYDGNITFDIIRGGTFTLAIRIPAWCKNYTLKVNGEKMAVTTEKGYWKLQKDWKAGEQITLDLELTVHLIYANPLINADTGKAAIQRGPVVYCLESVDNPYVNLPAVRLLPDTEFRTGDVKGLPDSTVALYFTAEEADSRTDLYSTEPPTYHPIALCAIPFALWQNRGISDMQIYFPVKN